MIKAIIVDDEEHCLQRLQNLLSSFGDEIELIGRYNNANKAIEGIILTQPDIVFLDIEIGELTGFEILKSLPKINFEVVFTTAYVQYALTAFKFSAINYLLKPIDIDDLHETIDRVKKVGTKAQSQIQLDILYQNLKSPNSANKKIAIPTLNGFTFISICDIIRCNSDINYTTIYLKDKKTLTVAKTLKEFEELLTMHNFFRVHNSHLVNLDYIKSYNKGKGGYVTLEDNTEIEVSTRRKDDFIKRMAEL